MFCEDKKIYLLVKATIFHYHGLDTMEKIDLDATAKEMEAEEELAWALDFISADYLTAFDRARIYLNTIINDYPKEKRISLILMIWQSNNIKGYITEMETAAMLKLARDWKVEKKLMELALN